MNGSILKRERKKNRLTQAEVGEKLGVSQQAVAKWENNTTEPKAQDLLALAALYDVTVDYLLGKESDRDTGVQAIIQDGLPYKRLPVLASVACGAPIYAEDSYENYILQSMETNADFCVVAEGDSMINARIFDGDIVYIRQQPTVENGEIAAVLIEDEATLKRFRLMEDRIILEPANPLFDSLVYRGSEMEQVHILGKAVAFTSNVR